MIRRGSWSSRSCIHGKGFFRYETMQKAGDLAVQAVERGSAAQADISGEDLLAAGIGKGPRIAAGLEAALRAKLEGRAVGKAAQLAVALEAARRHRPRRA